MRRGAWDFFAGLSLLLLVFVVWHWIRSYQWMGRFDIQSYAKSGDSLKQPAVYCWRECGTVAIGWINYESRLQFHGPAWGMPPYTLDRENLPGLRFWTYDGPHPWLRAQLERELSSSVPPPGGRFSRKAWGFAIFSIPRWDSTGSFSGFLSASARDRGVMFPFWAPAVLLACLPLCWTWKAIRARRVRIRLRHGLCVHCGYDLRASSERCPECGAAIQVPAPSRPSRRRLKGAAIAAAITAVLVGGPALWGVFTILRAQAAWGEDFNVQELAGPLMAAVKAKDRDRTRRLLDAGADPSYGDWNALHEAVTSGELPMVRLLVEHGADVNAVCSGGDPVAGERTRGLTPLHMACLMEEGDRSGIIALLLARGAVSNSPAELLADVAGLADIVGREDGAELLKLLLSKVKDPNVANPWNGMTALYSAAEHNLEKLAQALIAKGANVDARDENARSPLHYAAKYGRDDERMARLLLDHGADVNATDADGETPLAVARAQNKSRLAEYLESRWGRE